MFYKQINKHTLPCPVVLDSFEGPMKLSAVGLTVSSATGTQAHTHALLTNTRSHSISNTPSHTPARISIHIHITHIRSVMLVYTRSLKCTRTCLPAHAHSHTSTQALPCRSDLALGPTFSMRSMQGCRSRPKSMKTQSMPSRLYSSCSSTNMCWLKNCCSFSLVKLIHSCSKLLNCRGQRPAQPACL